MMFLNPLPSSTLNSALPLPPKFRLSDLLLSLRGLEMELPRRQSLILPSPRLCRLASFLGERNVRGSCVGGEKKEIEVLSAAMRERHSVSLQRLCS